MFLYQFTNEKKMRHTFQYKDELNIDHLEFAPYGQCVSGGLHFMNELHILHTILRI